MPDEKIERMRVSDEINDKFIPVVDYYSPGSIELAEAVSTGLKNSDRNSFKGHGVVSLRKKFR